MNKALWKATALIALTGVALTGCAQTNSGENSDGSSVTQNSVPSVEETRSAVQAKIAEYFKTAIEKSSDATTAVSGSEDKLKELLGEEDLNTLNNSSDPISGVEALSPDKQKAIADYYSSVNPLSDFYDFTGVKDSQRAVVEVISVVSSSFLNGADPSTEVTVDPSKIEVDGTKATVHFSDLKFTLNGNDVSSKTLSSITLPDYVFEYINGDWKISGAEAYKSYEALSSANASSTAEASSEPSSSN